MSLVGSYQNDRAEGMDEYFAALGVPWIARKIMLAITPSLVITKEGEEWSIKYKTAVMDQTIKFVIGVEFDEPALMGSEIFKCLASQDVEGELSIVSRTSMGSLKRDFKATDTGVILTMTVMDKNVEARRYFIRTQ